MDARSLRRTIPSLHSLMLFEAAARHLNFSKAAAELSITQPAVSQGVRQLEAAIGHSLFVREGRSIGLTAQGQRLFTAVSGGFASIAETVDDIAAMPRRDTLVLSTSTVTATEWLMPRISRFTGDHPNLIVDMRSLDRDPDMSLSEIDLHLRIGDGNWPGCEVRALWPEEISAVCNPRYLDEAGPIGTPDDLLAHRLIHYVDPYRHRLGWSEWLRAAGVDVPHSVPVALQVNDSLLALRAAENGEGVALGWRPVFDASLAAGKLVTVGQRVVETGRRFYAVTQSAPNRRRIAGVFRDWLVKEAGFAAVPSGSDDAQPTRDGSRAGRAG